MKLDYYKKPEKSRGLKLDANENLALIAIFLIKSFFKARFSFASSFNPLLFEVALSFPNL